MHKVSLYDSCSVAAAPARVLCGTAKELTSRVAEMLKASVRELFLHVHLHIYQ